jgi:hypothetical protein
MGSGPRKSIESPDSDRIELPPASVTARQKFACDQASFDRLTDADVISNEEA